MLSILSEIFMFLASRITDLWALICTILNFIEYSQNNSAETLLDGENNVAGQELRLICYILSVIAVTISFLPGHKHFEYAAVSFAAIVML